MFQTVRKSTDGKVLMLALSTGFTVRTRNPHWNRNAAGLGVQTLEWDCAGKGLTRDAADTLFDSLAKEAA